MTLLHDAALKISGVSKVYKIYKSPSELLLDYLFHGKRYQEFWALKDISLEIKKGDVVGIVGSNGAGKSTLLKLITGNLDLTEGTIEANGRTAAILELGSGFHPEYTGRENIVHGGIVAGMTPAEIESKMEEIIDFSGIREFIDQPFKTYSSGMQARLTFSLAISRQAEILILDEALAAGDAIFANKCLRRIKEICESDTTVLFVSHSTDSVRRFCNKAVWIEKGKVVLQADAETVTKAYDRYVYEQSKQYLQSHSISATELVLKSDFDEELDAEFFKYGSKEIKIEKVVVCGNDGNPKAFFFTGDFMDIRIYHEGKLQKPGEELHAGCQIFTSDGVYVTRFFTKSDADKIFEFGDAGYFSIILSPLLLSGGEYYVSPALYAGDEDGEQRWLDFHDRLYRFTVRSQKVPGAGMIMEHPAQWAYHPKR